MPFFTLSQAAKETCVSKATISRALKDGRLSYIEKTKSGYKIDASELFRVFSRNPITELPTERYEIPKCNPYLDELLTNLKEQNKQQQDIIEDLQKRLDRSEDARQDLTLRLEHTAKKKKLFGIF